MAQTAGDAERWERARERGAALVGRVRKLGPDRFWVPSQRAGEPGYEVVVVGRHPFCPCPAGQAGVPCAHSAALYLLAQRQREEAARRAVPVRRCSVCHLSGVPLFEGAPDGRAMCGQCCANEQREAGARRRRARAA
jgi:hypothetical protein